MTPDAALIFPPSDLDRGWDNCASEAIVVILSGITDATIGAMRVTSKGQVTIPHDVRRRLGVEPGSEVDFVIDDGAVRLIRLVRRGDGGGADIVKRMRSHHLSMTTDEIMALTRSES